MVSGDQVKVRFAGGCMDGKVAAKYLADLQNPIFIPRSTSRRHVSTGKIEVMTEWNERYQPEQIDGNWVAKLTN